MEELGAILETGGVAAVELVASALAERGAAPGPCANCGKPMIGAFCAVCGQPRNTHRRSLKHLFAEFVKDIVSFDSRILRTTKALMLKPGELACAFRDGRTQRYVPPVRLYLFVSLLFFLILSISGIAIFQIVLVAEPGKVTVESGHAYMTLRNGEREEVPLHYGDGRQHYNFNSRLVFFAREGTLHAELSPDAQSRLIESVEKAAAKAKNRKANALTRTIFASLLKLARDPAALNGSLTTWIPRALFLLLPLFAAVLAAFYWRQRNALYFVDHLVFSLGFHSFGFALLLIAAGLAQLVSAELVMWLTVGVLAGYLLVAMKRFYGQSWIWTGAKFATVSTLYTVFLVLPAFAGVISASLFWG